MNFKEFLNEGNVFKDDDWSKWSFPTKAIQYLRSVGGAVFGIGITKENWDSKADAERIFFKLWQNEYHLEKEFKKINKNPNEELCRYVTDTTVMGDMAPLCVINTAKGYMRFLENLDNDPVEIEDMEWSKPIKFKYLRITEPKYV